MFHYPCVHPEPGSELHESWAFQNGLRSDDAFGSLHYGMILIEAAREAFISEYARGLRVLQPLLSVRLSKPGFGPQEFIHKHME
jgi:hypothetical protein